MFYKIPLVFTPQPEGGYTVTSPLFPELVTEGDSLDEAMENVKDAMSAIIEIYQDLGRALPQNTQISDTSCTKIDGTWLSRTASKRWRVASEVV
jgi:antitoxin HicB